MKPKDKRKKDIIEAENPLIIDNPNFKDVRIRSVTKRYPKSEEEIKQYGANPPFIDEKNLYDADGAASIYMDPFVQLMKDTLGQDARAKLIDQKTIANYKGDKDKLEKEKNKRERSLVVKASSAALILMYALTQIQVNRGYVKLNSAKAAEDIGIKRTKFYEAIKFLSERDIIREVNGYAGFYWINPTYFFYGNRAEFFHENMISPGYTIVSNRFHEYKNPKKRGK